MLNQYENVANLEAHLHTTGPEIWRQTQGKITHFVAGLGTCGTITGSGRFLKSQASRIQVIGVHPEEGHDIPGVRSFRQLQATRLFLPDEYDALVEVSNRDAYDMCLRLNREESLIAGPSSAMALVGALRVIGDQPDALVVVIFPDNAFKYASSFERHFPQVQSGRPAEIGAASPEAQLLETLVANSRNPHNTCEVPDLQAALAGSDPPWLLDVRAADVFAKQHLPAARNVPLGELGARQGELPAGRAQPIVTVCNRGNLSITGMLVLQSLGYSNVRSLNGGTLAWADAGLPTRGRSPAPV
jgi:rhodanese-related sulfurtransferase